MDKQNTCQCGRETVRSEEERKRLIHRLNRIEGQIRGIRGMVECDAYCTDILTQSAAVSAAINSFNKELLNNHSFLLLKDSNYILHQKFLLH